jgi:hypothetical protein
MFDINNSCDFYQKMLEDFDDYMQQQDSARLAMNCAITAHHMADWVWGDFLKGNAILKAKLGIKTKDDFMAWIDGQTDWYELVQSISNGSKHFIRQASTEIVKYGGWGEGGFGHGPFGADYLAIRLHGPEVWQSLPLTILFEGVICFWRDFLRKHGPYDPLPEGRAKLFAP